MDIIYGCARGSAKSFACYESLRQAFAATAKERDELRRENDALKKELKETRAERNSAIVECQALRRSKHGEQE